VIFTTERIKDKTLKHVAGLLAQFLDNDADG
jgi:hypothetical protein